MFENFFRKSRMGYSPKHWQMIIKIEKFFDCITVPLTSWKARPAKPAISPPSRSNKKGEKNVCQQRRPRGINVRGFPDRINSPADILFSLSENISAFILGRTDLPRLGPRISSRWRSNTSRDTIVLAGRVVAPLMSLNAAFFAQANVISLYFLSPYQERERSWWSRRCR